MTTTSHLSQFNPNPSQPSLNKTRSTLIHRKYSQTVHHATNALVEIQQYQLVALLDMNAHASGMKCKFDMAVENAEDMIKYAPHWPTGYLRLGNILNMQGKYARAANIYGEALDKVPQDNPSYFRLLQLKNMVMEKSERCFDLISLVPTELAIQIFNLLPQVDKSICFNVSTMWRQRIRDNSGTIWKTIDSEGTEGDKSIDAAIARVLFYAAEEVQELNIKTEDRNLWFRYLDYMDSGRFKKLKSLSIEGFVTYNLIKTNTLMTLSNALWNLKNTLTTLDFTFRKLQSFPLYLSDVLFYCPNIIRLVVRSLNTSGFYFGNMEILGGKRHTLIDVEFRSWGISGSDLGPFLKYHPNIQRLVISSGLADDMIDVLYEHCPNLTLLGYGADHVTPLEKITYRDDNSRKPSGLQEIIAENPFYGTPAQKILQLVRDNAKSLQRVHANLSITQQQRDGGEPYPYVYPIYPSWKFEQLEHLSYHTDIYNASEPLFLQAIESCTTLKTLEVTNSSDINAIVTTLIKQPPLEALHIYDTKNIRDGGLALEKLFKLYEQALPTSKQKFHTVSFHCCDFITKEVLDSLAALESIRVVSFKGPGVLPSYEDLQFFLQKISQRLVKISCINISSIFDDDILDIFCTMPYLETLILEALLKITDQGIKNLVDNAKPSLRNLTIYDCERVSRAVVPYVQRKIISAKFY